jgi:pimeloyl-ACP methyl ester carboxylesterase
VKKLVLIWKISYFFLTIPNYSGATMKQSKYLWDEHSTRYQLLHSNSGKPYNWLFIPGGPGSDSIYFSSLIEELKLPGNSWLIDFPANGSNVDKVPEDYPFDEWSDCFLSLVKKFENPILVGHSFGGMFPLLFPELESILKGFVIISSAPSLWLEEAAKVAQEKKLPLLNEPMKAFERNPNQKTFKDALIACAPYYFAKDKLEEGKKLLEAMPFNFYAAVWWQKTAHEMKFCAKWVPEHVPTFILGGTEDSMTPPSLFENDKRFSRKNIYRNIIPNAGHIPWLEKMDEVKKAFNTFILSYLDKP